MAHENQHNNPIRNRDACVKAAHAHMRRRFPDVAVDKLLTQPVDATEIGVLAAGDIGKCPAAVAKRVVRYMRATFNANPGLEDEVNNVLRALLADRKRSRKTRDKD